MKHKFLFVCGLHRSGTSLVFQSLREHPEISGFRDTGVAEDEGQHLQTVFPPAIDKGGPGRFGFDPSSHMTEAASEVSAANREKLLAEWGRYWDFSRPVLLEKSPPNLVRTRFLQALFENAYFLIITRHPVAVSCATSKWLKSSPSKLLKHWIVCHRTYLEDAPHVAHKLVIRYEDFVADPDAGLAQIHAFVGVEPHAAEGITVRTDLNEKYFAMWRQMETRGLKGFFARRARKRFEADANRFGYSLQDF